MDKYSITITGEPLGIPAVDGGGLNPVQLEQIFLAALASLQRELVMLRMGLPAFGQRIVAPPLDGKH